MPDSSTPDELLVRGRAAARVGRLDEARDLLRRAVAMRPASVEAWLALAGVEDEAAEKARCFEAVLALDPRNAEAQLGLDLLRGGLRLSAPAQGQADDDLEAVIAQASRQLEDAVGPPLPGQIPADEVLYCANHPNVETMLRCNRCGKPICTRCAVRTPVGYRCRECVGQQQAVFYTGGAGDYVIGGAIALVCGGIAGYLMTLLGIWFFGLILGPTVGIGIAEAVRAAVRRRRSRSLWLVVAIGIAVGALPALWISLASLNLFRLLTVGLFLVLAVSAAVARLR